MYHLRADFFIVPFKPDRSLWWTLQRDDPFSSEVLTWDSWTRKFRLIFEVFWCVFIQIDERIFRAERSESKAWMIIIAEQWFKINVLTGAKPNISQEYRQKNLNRAAILEDLFARSTSVHYPHQCIPQLEKASKKWLKSGTLQNQVFPRLFLSNFISIWQMLKQIM